MSLMDSDASSPTSAPPEHHHLRRRRRSSTHHHHRHPELEEYGRRKKNHYLRGLFNRGMEFHLFLVLLCSFLCLVRCEPCPVNAIEKTGISGCGSYGDDRFEDTIVADAGAHFDTGSSTGSMNSDYSCTNAHSFCFLSTLPGYVGEEHKVREENLELSSYQSDCPVSLDLNQRSSLTGNKSWIPDYGTFELINGRTVVCSLNSEEGFHGLSSLVNQKDDSSSGKSVEGSEFKLSRDSEMTKSSPDCIYPSPHVEVSPSILDWGRKYLYFPSVVFLTVANTCNDSILYVYEPYTTDVQFYPCNFSEVKLGPGEVASLCFVFLPRWMGLSSAHLILQTNIGGFVIQAKGYGMASPYAISPMMGIDIPSSGELRKNLSVFNPFSETILVKELSAWVSLSLGNVSHQSEATCSVGNFMPSEKLSKLSAKDWLSVTNGESSLPLLSLRPHDNWEVAPNKRETIVEIDLSFGSEGRIVGAFCMHLLRPSQNEFATVIVPLEASLNGGRAHDNVVESVTVLLEALPCYSCKTPVVAISLHNRASHLLGVVKISVEGSRIFQIKYTEGLLLFPGSMTQVAVVGCPQQQYELSDSKLDDCKLIILKNDSSTPIEVPAQDIAHLCYRHKKDSSIGYDNEFVRADTSNLGSGSLEAGMEGYSESKFLETAKADEFVLDNWKSHRTTSGLSVISDHEMSFPVVEVGSYFSKWVAVKNPSEEPVVVQLILNSAEIVDKCKGTVGFVLLSAGGFIPNGAGTTRYGFSLVKAAVTEAYIQPGDEAFLGPIVFHPSNRCLWRSSALIRNNLSGVEWFYLQGFGGSHSLVLLEGHEPVESVEFNLKLPLPFNMSSSDMLMEMEETYEACREPLTKKLFLKNMGDLPLEVKGIKVSGKECSSDGFLVHACEGFSLEPGESTKLQVSYQTDLSGTSIHRDLELALGGGNFVIPMKASLPLYALNLCKKSFFLMRLKKFSAAVFLVVSVVLLVVYLMLHQATTVGSQDCSYKSKRSSSVTFEGGIEKPSRTCRKESNIKFSASTDVDNLGFGEGKSLKWGSLERSFADEHGGANCGKVVQHAKSTLEPDVCFGFSSYTREEKSTPLLQKYVGTETPSVVEATEPCKLTVRTAKEKGRRRRKRKVVPGGITGFEVSSSQSGNSTPSSPLSPVISVMPDRMWSPSPALDPIEVKNPFTQAATRDSQKAHVSPTMVLAPKLSFQNSSSDGISGTEGQSPTRKVMSKPALLPSATFPCTSRPASNLPYFTPSLTSISAVAPHARAPGSKHYDQSNVKLEADTGDKYAYDIWGDHLPGLHLMKNSKDLKPMSSIVSEPNSSSFFVRGPQALMKKSPLRPVSCVLQEG
ncbi:unnamed protein product [Linum tenue]|uniref:Transmembrane protein n=1 Tax=Linum tenue TaxID=586396 RepID=A0AAV0RCN0_9ROSI|nr:unnamed protein product [Linum tenue]